MSRPALTLVAVAALLLVLVGSLAFGSVDVGLDRVVGAFTAYDGGNDQRIVLEIRVPRTLVGLVVGAALGLAGAIMQALTRNPLAEPGLLGINAGASLAVVAGIALLDPNDPGRSVPFALAGAAAAAVAVASIGSVGARGATPVKLVIAGAALTALLSSATSAVLVIDEATLTEYRFWVVGSIAGRGLEVLAAVAIPLLLGAVIGIGVSRALNALALGDDVARGLGVRLGIVRGAGVLAVVLLAGGAVAAAGPIVFVGLAVPHVARLLAGPDWRWVVPLSAVIGPILLVGADVIGRVVARPGELQVGVVTVLVGAPLFIWLVRRQRLAEL